MSIASQAAALLTSMGVDLSTLSGGPLRVHSPIDGTELARLRPTSITEADVVLKRAQQAFLIWREVPAPRRGELLRVFATVLREHQDALGLLVTLETGKLLSEGRGEVQEMIDICDYACGLSRQFGGRTLASERPLHRMMETWHPLGVVGVISAFNFPVAVWAWNAALALACGNAVVWKPSEKTPLSALAVQALFDTAAQRFGGVPEGLCALLLGGRELGSVLADDPRVPLLSATGSTAMGRAVAPRLAARFARSILELGGNNAAILTPSADPQLTLRAVAFAALGTAGQRCTSLRRLIVHADVFDSWQQRLAAVWASVKLGDPRAEGVLVGPLIDEAAGQAMDRALARARAEGGAVLGGEPLRAGNGGCYRRPALVSMPAQTPVVCEETFAPILYLLRYRTLDEALALNNGVAQGLSSSIFTRDITEAERFMAASGSDCGIANVNIGPSGAEIGGAFGGEKDTGGGREAGSDSWKAYMRRATNTINYGDTLPLAQGVSFPID